MSKNMFCEFHDDSSFLIEEFETNTDQSGNKQKNFDEMYSRSKLLKVACLIPDKVFLVTEAFAQNVSMTKESLECLNSAKIIKQLAGAFLYLHQNGVYLIDFCLEKLYAYDLECIKLGFYYNSFITNYGALSPKKFTFNIEYSCLELTNLEKEKLIKYIDKIDTWSFGVGLYNLLMKKSFYYEYIENKKLVLNYSKLLKEDLKKLENDKLESLVLSCLDQDIAKRPAFDQILNFEYFDETGHPETINAEFSEYLSMNKIETCFESVTKNKLTKYQAFRLCLKLNNPELNADTYKLNIQFLLNTKKTHKRLTNENGKVSETKTLCVSSNKLKELIQFAQSNHILINARAISDEVEKSKNIEEMNIYKNYKSNIEFYRDAFSQNIVDMYLENITLNKIFLEFPFSSGELLFHDYTKINEQNRVYYWLMLLGIDHGHPGSSSCFSCIGSCDTYLLETKRQIEMDVSRCHRYHPLISSFTGQKIMNSILMEWAMENRRYLRYWQGFDSILANILSVFYICKENSLTLRIFQRITDVYLRDVFSRKDLLMKHLKLMQKLFYFHDYKYASYLVENGLTPNVYAVSWITTMFTRTFTLTQDNFSVAESIKMLDYLFFIRNEKFVLNVMLMCVAIIKQYKKKIMKQSNNLEEYVQHVVDSQDIPKFINLHGQLLSYTPASITSSINQNIEKEWNNELATRSPQKIEDPHSFDAINIYRAPEIDYDDFRKNRNIINIIDLREYELYDACHISHSYHVQWPQNDIGIERVLKTLRKFRKKIWVLLDVEKSNIHNKAFTLMEAGFLRVCSADFEELFKYSGLFCSCSPTKSSQDNDNICVCYNKM